MKKVVKWYIVSYLDACGERCEKRFYLFDDASQAYHEAKDFKGNSEVMLLTHTSELLSCDDIKVVVRAFYDARNYEEFSCLSPDDIDEVVEKFKLGEYAFVHLIHV